MVIPFIFGLPIALGIVVLVFFLTERRQGLAHAAIFFLLTLAVGSWDIFRSRSSTAALGFLFLPSYAAAAGTLGLIFGRWRRADRLLLRWIGWACLVGALAINLVLVYNGVKTIQRNQSRDAAQK